MHVACLLLRGRLLHLSVHEDVALLVKERGIQVLVDRLFVDELGHKVFLPFFCLTFSEVGYDLLCRLNLRTLGSLKVSQNGQVGILEQVVIFLDSKIVIKKALLIIVLFEDDAIDRRWQLIRFLLPNF